MDQCLLCALLICRPAGTDPGLAARLFAAGPYRLMAQWHLAPGSFAWPEAAAALAAGGYRGT